MYKRILWVSRSKIRLKRDGRQVRALPYHRVMAPPTLRSSRRNPSTILFRACCLMKWEFGPLMPRYSASSALRRCAPIMDASTTCTARPEGDVCSLGTVPWMAPIHVRRLPWPATAMLVTPSSWGEASDEVTLAAVGTRQYLWGSNLATSECGLTNTLPNNAPLDAVTFGDSVSFGRCTPCGH